MKKVKLWTPTILQMKKLRLWEVKLYAQDQRGIKWYNQDLSLVPTAIMDVTGLPHHQPSQPVQDCGVITVVPPRAPTLRAGGLVFPLFVTLLPGEGLVQMALN